MELRARRDLFGNPSFFTADKFRKILDLLDVYMKGTPYAIAEMWENDVSDPNGRIDIEIIFEDKASHHLIQQKLLILKGELIDGKTFHLRHDEWYPEGGLN